MVFFTILIKLVLQEMKTYEVPELLKKLADNMAVYKHYNNHKNISQHYVKENTEVYSAIQQHHMACKELRQMFPNSKKMNQNT